ncbi:MAG TPA: sugar phosphate isomerase/epimerase [Dehalococcoidia bacterium]|nr:sugar phosphate isomerase/epimerase [Dehalococcoidia bacterium]
MRLALNGATIMRSSLDDDIEIAAETGFTALEIWAGKLDAYLGQRSIEELAHKLRALAVRPWCINSIEDITFRDAAGRRAIITRLDELAAAARAIGAPAIVVVPGQRPDGFNRHESVRDAVDMLRAMSDAAGETGLAFEFLGKPGCSVPTLDMASEIVTAVDRANVGMVIDTFHFHAGGSRLDDVAAIPVEKLFVVHLNGCEDAPREQLTDAHRLYPGEGAIAIGAILRGLRARGFDGTASVEIFRPEYWQQEPRLVAARARASAAAVLAEAGYEVTR